MRHRSTCTKSERGKSFKTSLSLQLNPAPAYSGEETGRIAQFAACFLRQIGSLAVPRFAGFQPDAGMYI